MRRQTNGTRGSVLIEQAIATLVNNQAAFVTQLNENNKMRAEAELLNAQARQQADLRFAQAKQEADQAKQEADLRFSRIEKELEEIKAILQQLLPDLLAKLPDAVSRKIGFKPK